MEPRNILDRVRRAVAEGGDAPHLVGYDVNEIQALVTASSRPIVMRGASEAIARFDREKERRAIFAGGGRGLLVAGGAAQASVMCDELRRRFRETTLAGNLVTASVELDPTDHQSSLRWLRQRLDIEKDAAPKPDSALPASKAEQCESCTAGKATLVRVRHGRDERICERCAAMIKVGGSEEGMAQSLNDLSPSGRIAAVSADGNHFGALFDGLRTLEELAIVSTAVREIFGGAREAAESLLRKSLGRGSILPIVSVAVGGDDIRAFVAEEHALAYARELVNALKMHSLRLAGELRAVPVVPAAVRERIAAVGVGIGLIASDSHFPAYRLLEYAHDLERSAKRRCSDDPSRGSAAARFALDFAVLRSGGELIQGFDHRSRDPSDIRPIDLTGDREPAVFAQATALARIPTAQQALFARAARADEGGAALDAEMASALRYQVARSDQWQRYYKACGASWKDANQVERFRPRRGMFDLTRLLGGNHAGV